MSTIASLMVRIGADISELERGLSKVSRQVEDTGKRMTQMGKTISTRVTAPLTALATVAVRAFGRQEQAEMRLRAALRANGREVNSLFNQYNTFAKEMQRVTVIGDEATLEMLAQAEALGLTADSAERAVKNSIAMQSAFGVNAQSALRYTAALEQGNATMLTRYLPALREIEDESERVAKAQELLSRAFSSAEAEAESTTGQITQMRNAVGDLMEDFGEIVSKAIMPFINRIQELAEEFQELEGEAKARIVAIAGLFAASGPLLIALGTALRAIAAFTMIVGRQFTVIAGSIGAAAIAVQWLIDNFEALQARARRMARDAGDSVGEFLSQWFPAFGKLRQEMSELETDIDEADFIGAEHEKGLTSFTESAKNLANTLGDVLFQSTGLSDIWDDIIDKLTPAMSQAEDQAEEFGNGISRAAIRARTDMDALSQSLIRTVESGEGVVVKAHEMGRGFDFAEQMAISFTSSFGDGLNNVIVAGERVVDMLRNIGRLLVSSAIQTGLRMLLTGGTGGITGGLFGRVFGVNDALITSSGDVVKFHPDDNILAMKDFSGIGGSSHVRVSGEIQGSTIRLSNARAGREFR